MAWGFITQTHSIRVSGTWMVDPNEGGTSIVVGDGIGQQSPPVAGDHFSGHTGAKHPNIQFGLGYEPNWNFATGVEPNSMPSRFLHVLRPEWTAQTP